MPSRPERGLALAVLLCPHTASSTSGKAQGHGMVPALFSFGDLSVGVSVPKYLLLPHAGVLGSEARAGKSSEVSQTRNPGKEVEPAKPVGGKQARRRHCSLGGRQQSCS